MSCTFASARCRLAVYKSANVMNAELANQKHLADFFKCCFVLMLLANYFYLPHTLGMHSDVGSATFNTLATARGIINDSAGTSYFAQM
jgi:hypothetical protein